MLGELAILLPRISFSRRKSSHREEIAGFTIRDHEYRGVVLEALDSRKDSILLILLILAQHVSERKARVMTMP